jgi:hypothetical protein
MVPDAPVEQLAPKSLENPLKSLQILKDVPLSEESEKGGGIDAFNHDAYAAALFRVLCDNKPPLSIGLFGAWGIGKSTVLNLLRNKIRDGGPTLKYIYFNAWKYSGDSFRRQFLIEIARGVYGDTHSEVQRLEELNFNSVIKQAQENTFISKLAAAMKEALRPNYAIKPQGITRFVLGILGIVVVTTIGSVFSRFNVFFASIVSAAGISGVFLWFANLKFEDLFIVQETPIYDPKLVFPEQFEAEFKKIVGTLSSRNEHAVIAIDDIDRCEASVIRDILTATKNFIGDHNCFFVIPCDERTVIDVFNLTPDQAQSYKDESLRKYFNVSVRIPAISSSDLVDFANQIVRRTNLPNEVVQLAILGNCRDARKMKHFINSLALKYQVAKARENAGLMPRIVDANVVALAKAVLIEDAFPEFYMALMENPRLYALADKSSDSAEIDPELDRMAADWPWWKRTWPPLQAILRRTKDFAMPGDGILFTLKSGSIQARIPRGVDLDNALIQGDLTVVKEILSEIQTEPQKMAVTDLIEDKLRASKAIFLQHSIAVALLAEEIAGFVPHSRHQATGVRAISLLVSNEEQRVLAQDVGRVVNIAQKLSPTKMPPLLTKYANELKYGGFAPSFIKVLPELIEILYSVKEWQDTLGPVLNSRLPEWALTVSGLEAIAQIRMPDNVSDEAYVPSKDVTRTITIAKMDSSSIELNEIQRRIAFAHWSDEFSSSFLMHFRKILVDTPKVQFGPELKFVFGSIIERPEMLAAENDPAGFWPVFINTLNALKDTEARQNALYVLGLYSQYGPTQPIRLEAQSALKRDTDLFSDQQIRSYLEFLSGYGAKGEALKSELVQQQFTLLKAEANTMAEPSLQRLELCIDYPHVIKQPDVEALIEDGLGVTADATAETWAALAKNYMVKLTDVFPERLCDRSLNLISTSNSPGRLGSLCGLFAASLPHVSSPVDADLLTKYFKNLTSETPTIRDCSARGLADVRNAKTSLLPFFKMKVEFTLGEISQLQDASLRGFRTVLDSILEFPDSINPRGSELIFVIAKRFLHMDDGDDKIYGLSMVERSETILGSDISDITYLAIHLAETTPSVKDRVIKVIPRIRDYVSEEARERIQAFTSNEQGAGNP